MAEQVQCVEEQKEEILQYQKQQKLKKYTKFQCFWELELIKVKRKQDIVEKKLTENLCTRNRMIKLAHKNYNNLICMSQ